MKKGAIAAFKSDIASLRTGRASANVLDPVMVEAYGSRVPLNQVANITVPEPRMLSVSIWDRSMVNAVDRAIRESNRFVVFNLLRGDNRIDLRARKGTSQGA